VNFDRASVTVPPNGSAEYTVSVSIDGNQLRDTATPIQFQWYVVAERTGQTLRMPFYLKASRTLPSQPLIQTETVSDMVLAPDAGSQVLGGVTYVDYPMTLDSSVLTLEGTLEFLEIADSGVNDLDFYLYGPDDPNFEHPIAVSGVQGGPEHIKVSISRPGLYTWRVVGYLNAPATQYTLTTTRTLGNRAPTAQPIAGEFINASGKPVDFDGSFRIEWQGNGGETGYEVERSTDGVNYETITRMPINETSLSLNNQPNGELTFRVRALTAGIIGSYVTSPSNSQSIIVDRRTKIDITSQIQTAISNLSFSGGVFNLDLNIRNNSSTSYLPLVELNVIKINSATGTVSVRNADNQGDGRSTATSALFGYSNLLGADQVFGAAEVTGNRSLQFNDAAAELFTFDVNVTAFQQTGEAGAVDPTAGAPAGSSGGAPASGPSLPASVIRITISPLTRIVTARLL
jgi:hypothetical protein